MMMALGMFVFSLSTAAYQELQRQTEWRHASNSRIGAAPAQQYLGRGDDKITLPGIILPELAGSVLSLDTLRLMANTGKAWPMVEGSGRIYGLWVIESLSETKTIFFRDGTPRRLEFTINLKRIDDDRIDLLGAATSTGVNIMRMLL
ncbi:Unclassified tail protein [Pseudomonas chlororaphis subsp. aureofaciens]|uniref:phage tail protein n=1 Tax=Pseudomonas chlororaphis TaxID=587753 RepID=UPI000F589622|nr:phage tail protein [Pseudomonas chlororaphis]AZD84747.1 Unclassified tail protein [Pseudomonas chlororaphis subsp. aureofaciens]